MYINTTFDQQKDNGGMLCAETLRRFGNYAPRRPCSGRENLHMIYFSINTMDCTKDSVHRQLLSVCWRTLLLVLLDFTVEISSSPPSTVFIGVLIGRQDVDAAKAVRLAVNRINSDRSVLPNTKFQVLYNTSGSHHATFTSIRNTCYQIEQGVAIVIGPVSSSEVKATHPICAGVRIPQIAPIATDPTLSTDTENYPYLLKMSGSDSKQSRALVDVMKHYGWTTVAVLTSQSEYGRNGLQEFHRIATQNDWHVISSETFFPTDKSSEIKVAEQLLRIRSKGVRVVILSCLAEHGRVVLDTALGLGMTRPGWAWVVTDGITTLGGLFDPCVPVPFHLRGIIGTRPAYGRGTLYKSFIDSWNTESANGNKISRTPQKSLPEAYALRIYDSILVAAYGLQRYLEDGHGLATCTHKAGICSSQNVSPCKDGDLLFRYLHNVSGPGVMNHLNFTDANCPYVTDYDVVNLQAGGWTEVGKWSPAGGLEMKQPSGVYFQGDATSVPRDLAMDLTNLTLEIVMIIEEPFTMIDKNKINETDTERLTGLCVDMIKFLQRKLKFNYNLHLVGDGNYGGQNSVTKEWNGMVRELIDGKADVAVSAMFITYERQQYIDFTKPFMDLGLVILMPETSPQTNLFAFMEPFELSLWTAVIGAMIVCGVATTVCSYLSPFGFYGRYAQRLDLKNQINEDERKKLNVFNSLWFSFAALMQQGPEANPRCLSGRLVSGFWWAAVTIIIATYTANLAAFLTVSRLDAGINSIYDLADQRLVHYGTLNNSAIKRFFEIQSIDPYRKMYSFMQSMGTWVPNSSVGIRLVQESYGQPKNQEGSRFAFIYDSTILDYTTRNPPCNTMTVGRVFNRAGYGIALRKNSHYTETLSSEVLKLRESGEMEILERKWIAGSCPSAETGSSTSTASAGERLDFESMLGVFYCLLGGVGLGLLIIIIEYCIAAAQDTAKDKKSGYKNHGCLHHMRRRLKVTYEAIFSDFCRSSKSKRYQVKDDNERRAKANNHNVARRPLTHHNLEPAAHFANFSARNEIKTRQLPTLQNNGIQDSHFYKNGNAYSARLY